MRALPVVDHLDAPRSPGARRAHYTLRVSVLSHCTHHCPYCLPGAARAAAPHAIHLDVRDHARLAPLFGACGVRKVRFTGGEPLLRADIADVVAAWRAALPHADLALTTNGQRLSRLVDQLVHAGLDRFTVHLDTLRAERYATLMGLGSPAAVLDAAMAAHARIPVKINMVVQRDRNDDELDAFVALSRSTGMQVRFIELMSTGVADDDVRRAFVAGRSIVERLHGEPVGRAQPDDPAALFRTSDGTVFGVIASDTEPFCDACNRLRLTADGQVRGCLYQSGGAPLGHALRSGASDDTLHALLAEALDDKRSWHPLQNAARVAFSMADVGG